MTPAAGPVRWSDPDALAEAIVREVGTEIVLGLPLGLGKANHVANALYARAAADRSISLRIFTALTLSRPQFSSELERRFLAPIMDRVFGGYPELAYVEPLRSGALPPNVEVNEFFLQAGAWLGSPRAQQGYISANYTHAMRYVLERGLNVVGQLVAEGGSGGRYSLSCNSDTTLDLLAQRRAGSARFLLVGQVNAELPYMPGEAEIEPPEFGHVLKGPAVEFPLPGPPQEPVDLVDHAIGLNVASLVPDGGTLQIGIGSLGHAVAHGLLLRHHQPARFAEILGRLPPSEQRLERFTGSFETGLYAASEMFVDAFLDLYRAGVLKREVGGAVLHAAFFLGPRAFYQALRELAPADRARFRMAAVSFVNALDRDDTEARRRARAGGRFVNSAMLATLLGAVTSDGLEDGRVVSGVGGQYNFVAQAFSLDDARSVIVLPATREEAGRATSNIRWTYGHTTIPRHLRDIVVTEYGVADLRGRPDADVVAAMLAITDSRFQASLLAEAKRAGKIDKAYEIPAQFRNNTPERIERALSTAREAGLLPTFPFGSEFTDVEQRLLPALKVLKTASGSRPMAAGLVARGLVAPSAEQREALRRLGLDRPRGFRERLYALLVRGALARPKLRAAPAANTQA